MKMHACIQMHDFKVITAIMMLEIFEEIPPPHKQHAATPFFQSGLINQY